MAGIDTTIRTRTEKRHRLEVSGVEILQAINQELKASCDKHRIPLDATIVVHVPGGGDWSNTELDLNERPVEIRWTEVEES